MGKEKIPKIIKRILSEWCGKKIEYLRICLDDGASSKEIQDYYGLGELNKVIKFLGEKKLKVGDLIDG